MPRKSNYDNIAMAVTMEGMHGASRFSMALVSYITLRKNTQYTHQKVISLIHVYSPHFNEWCRRCFGMTLGKLYIKILKRERVAALPKCHDSSAARAIDFIIK